METPHVPGNATLGRRVKALRTAPPPPKAPTRPEVLAAALGISHATLYRIEAGDGCRSETLPTLAQALGVSLDYLFGLSEDPRPAPG